jgi:hypothetical protein
MPLTVTACCDFFLMLSKHVNRYERSQTRALRASRSSKRAREARLQKRERCGVQRWVNRVDAPLMTHLRRALLLEVDSTVGFLG